MHNDWTRLLRWTAHWERGGGDILRSTNGGGLVGVSIGEKVTVWVHYVSIGEKVTVCLCESIVLCDKQGKNYPLVLYLAAFWSHVTALWLEVMLNVRAVTISSLDWETGRYMYIMSNANYWRLIAGSSFCSGTSSLENLVKMAESLTRRCLTLRIITHSYYMHMYKCMWMSLHTTTTLDQYPVKVYHASQHTVDYMYMYVYWGTVHLHVYMYV